MERIILDAAGKPWYAVEVEPDVSPLRGVAQTAENVARGVADVGEVIAQSSREILEAMREGLGDVAPDEIELKFGVSLRGDLGIPIIAKASGEATFTVRVCWKPGT
ncbi:hypothetical protein ASF87_10320 [Microbacterium sp. Leaf161]|uniref:CU044_2847 family protein n=1 Tax=Microbacterium sp. Leaf161 TaxID=1736281 RepID=UPI0006FA84CC|nr:CU044_2847 family protein [Microbacterium sp. Leaf161]KQR49177.1 hypothetical protein ASF87_10320 [Microbacterium sp. Leaf161]